MKSVSQEKRYTNFFGTVFPTYDHDAIARIFGIEPSARVLDVGGGHNPFVSANYIVDTDMTHGIHRDGQVIYEAKRGRYIKADIHSLPFPDKSMDFVFCSHVLEHVSDPERACKEIIRVGKRGFIETPRKWVEFFAGYPSHRWLIDLVDGVIIFERRCFIDSPFLNFALPPVWNSTELQERALKKYRNISHVQLSWEGAFKYRVIDHGGGFDYSNPYHAALAHFFFARNILRFSARPDYGVFHAEHAAILFPEVDLFQVLCAVYALLLRNDVLWHRSSEFLRGRGIVSGTDMVLARVGLRNKTAKRLLRIVDEQEPPEKV